ncbi:MAG: cytochrome D1 domain-containing protein [Gammaproteobacteria bacterium]
MKHWIDLTWRGLLAVGLLGMGLDMAAAQTPPQPQPEKLYQEHCAACHHPQRTGAMGPALLPESLSRLRRPEAARVIAQGRVATQMPGFHDKLSDAEVQALAQWIYTPVLPAPTWTDADIRASRVETAGAADWPARPQWRADPMNLFVVVESGDHHISLVDGDRFEVIHRFASRYALHGGPKFTPDGRFVYFGSRDGWVTKYDLWNLKVVAEVRAGLNMRNVAVSGDGRWVMAANFLPHSVVLFDHQLRLVRSMPTTSADGKASSRVSAAYDATPRKAFMAAMKDTPEIWEVAWDGSSVRRTLLEEPMDDFFFDQAYRFAMGATRKRADGTAGAQVVDLDARRKIAELPIAGMPHLGSGITFAWGGTTVLASPNLENGHIDVIDMKTWKTVRSIATPGPGFFMRSHEKTPFAWTDSMMSPTGKDTLTIIDKRTLEVAGRVREPGRTLAHIEFTRNGSHALASVLEQDGALVIYDAATFREVKRLPMKRPVGKYNIWNKITRSEGTSR